MPGANACRAVYDEQAKMKPAAESSRPELRLTTTAPTDQQEPLAQSTAY